MKIIYIFLALSEQSVTQVLQPGYWLNTNSAGILKLKYGFANVKRRTCD